MFLVLYNKMYNKIYSLHAKLAVAKYNTGEVCTLFLTIQTLARCNMKRTRRTLFLHALWTYHNYSPLKSAKIAHTNKI